MDLVTRVETEAGPHGCRPRERPVEDHVRLGVVNLDKPPGPTSHQVAAWVREVLDVGKAGQGGTLDPKVTGVLPIGIEDAARALDLVSEASKTYVGLLHLHDEVPAPALKKALSKFTGEIEQTPPAKAAVKRRPRTRRIHRLQVLEREGRDVLFEVACEAGTYVRTLAEDLGEALGVGAHLEELRRTEAGPMHADDSVTLQDLQDAVVFWREDGDESWLREAVQPVEVAVTHLPTVVARDTAVDAVCHGADLAVPGVARLTSDLVEGERVTIHGLKGELVGWGRAEMDAQTILEASRGIAVETGAVLMAPGTYPKGW